MVSIAETDTSKPVSAFLVSISVHRTHVNPRKFAAGFGKFIVGGSILQFMFLLSFIFSIKLSLTRMVSVLSLLLTRHLKRMQSERGN